MWVEEKNVTEWKSIDTAPRDGSEFLAFDPVVKLFDVCVMSSMNVRGVTYWHCYSTQYDGEYGSLSVEFNADRATIWTHLPKLDERGMPT